MEMPAHMPALRNGADHFLTHVAGMARHIPDPLHSGDGVHQFQETRKSFLLTAVLAVGVDVLAEQRKFPVAQGHCSPDFPADGFRLAAALASAHIRHDAVRAEVVAAVHDGYPGGKTALAHKTALEFLRHDGQVIKKPLAVMTA